MSSPSLSHRPYPLPHTKSMVQRTAQTMFLQKSILSPNQISISVNSTNSQSHTWNMRIPLEDWKSLVPTIESSIGSAFRNEAIEVTVSFMEAQGKKSFDKGKVELTDVFGAVLSGETVA